MSKKEVIDFNVLYTMKLNQKAAIISVINLLNSLLFDDSTKKIEYLTWFSKNNFPMNGKSFVKHRLSVYVLCI